MAVETKRVIAFMRWHNKHGNNADVSEYEKAFIAGWKASLKEKSK